MKRVLSSVVTSMLVLLCLTGCEETQTLEGKWQDETGYKVQFLNDGTFVEDSFGTPMEYIFDGEHLVYSWADGYTRCAPLVFEKKDVVSFQMNGKVRRFQQTKNSPDTPVWKWDEIPVSTQLTGKFTLLSNVGVQSELRTLAGNLFALSWAKGDSQLPAWNIPDDTNVFGRYVDRGEGQSLVLYTADDLGTIQYEQFAESSSGAFIATMKLEGSIDNITEDWSSPVEWRGYTISGTVGDDASVINYHFYPDNTAVKELADGMMLNYAYFVDKEGLVILSCLDGFIDTDTIWLDTKTGDMYRMVYERDSWVEYMHAIALANGSTPIEAPNGSTSKSHIMDSEILFDADSTPLLGGYGSALGELYSLVSHVDADKAVSDYNAIQDSHTDLAYDLLTREEQEAKRQADKEAFLSEMGVLAEQKRIADEQAAQAIRDQMIAEGYMYDAETDSWYLPGSVTTGEYGENNPWENPYGSSNSSTSSTGSTQFGGSGTNSPDRDESPSSSTDPGTTVVTQPSEIEKPVNTTVATVRFYCNCNSCHTDDTPVSRGASNIALVDASIWEPGVSVVLGDEAGSPQVTLVDSQGFTSGSVIIAYFADHDWVQSRSDGTYSVIPIEN